MAKTKVKPKHIIKWEKYSDPFGRDIDKTDYRFYDETEERAARVDALLASVKDDFENEDDYDPDIDIDDYLDDDEIFEIDEEDDDFDEIDNIDEEDEY